MTQFLLSVNIKLENRDVKLMGLPTILTDLIFYLNKKPSRIREDFFVEMQGIEPWSKQGI